jgi:two-component system chemotaxis response regulator CheB
MSDQPSRAVLTIIAIGASAGGVDAIRTIVSQLPANLDAAVFVVLHIGAHKSELPWLLNRAGHLPTSHPKDGEPIEPGHIYVAPPDHHMTIDPGVIHLTKGPRENWARPAIDPLFRSAARAYGPAVIGVILTGGLNDGTAGLIEVKQHDGIAIVQDPQEAADPSMPRSALAHVDVDHCVPLAKVSPLLVRIAGARARSARIIKEMSANLEAAEDRPGQDMEAQFTQHHPVAVTCPDCGGALRETETGSLAQYTCHIGHVYTAEVMLTAQFAALERAIEAAMRALGERAELCRQMAEKSDGQSSGDGSANWTAAMHEALDQVGPLRGVVEREWIHPVSKGVPRLSDL